MDTGLLCGICKQLLCPIGIGSGVHFVVIEECAGHAEYHGLREVVVDEGEVVNAHLDGPGCDRADDVVSGAESVGGGTAQR